MIWNTQLNTQLAITILKNLKKQIALLKLPECTLLCAILFGLFVSGLSRLCINTPGEYYPYREEEEHNDLSPCSENQEYGHLA